MYICVYLSKEDEDEDEGGDMDSSALPMSETDDDSQMSKKDVSLF